MFSITCSRAQHAEHRHWWREHSFEINKICADLLPACCRLHNNALDNAIVVRRFGGFQRNLCKLRNPIRSHYHLYPFKILLPRTLPHIQNRLLQKYVREKVDLVGRKVVRKFSLRNSIFRGEKIHHLKNSYKKGRCERCLFHWKKSDFYLLVIENLVCSSSFPQALIVSYKGNVRKLGQVKIISAKIVILECTNCTNGE